MLAQQRSLGLVTLDAGTKFKNRITDHAKGEVEEYNRSSRSAKLP